VIVCQRCGFANEDHNSFCNSCGSYLEWAGVVPSADTAEPDRREQQASEPSPEPTPAAEAELSRAPTGAPSKSDPTPSDTSSPTEHELGPKTEQLPPTTLTADLPSAATQPRDQGAGERHDLADDRVASPSADAGTREPFQPKPRQPEVRQPGVRQPGARQPAPSRTRTAPRRAPAPQPLVLPGQEACPACGIGNDRSRTFCRHCGVVLHPTTVTEEHLHWWQRALRWLHEHRHRELKAGERPGQHRRLLPQSAPGWLSGTIAKVVTVVIVVFAILATVGPVHRPIDHKLAEWKNDVLLALHPSYDPVHPITAAATSSMPGHPPQLVIDGLSNTFWATGSADNGVGTTLTIRFASPTTINRVGFLIGDQSTPAAYLSEARPELVHLAFLAKPNVGTTLLLQDTAKFQTFAVDAKDATEMTLTIDSVYPSAIGHDCAITQIEFFTKRP